MEVVHIKNKDCQPLSRCKQLIVRAYPNAVRGLYKINLLDGNGKRIGQYDLRVVKGAIQAVTPQVTAARNTQAIKIQQLKRMNSGALSITKSTAVTSSGSSTQSSPVESSSSMAASTEYTSAYAALRDLGFYRGYLKTGEFLEARTAEDERCEQSNSSCNRLGAHFKSSRSDGGDRGWFK